MKKLSQNKTSVNQKNKKLSLAHKEKWKHLTYLEACSFAEEIKDKQAYTKRLNSDVKRIEMKKAIKFVSRLDKYNTNFIKKINNPSEDNIEGLIPLMYAIAKNQAKDKLNALENISLYKDNIDFLKEFAECRSSAHKINKMSKHHNKGISDNKYKLTRRMMLNRHHMKNIVIDNSGDIVIKENKIETIIVNLLQPALDAYNLVNESLDEKCFANSRMSRARKLTGWAGINLRNTKDPRVARLLSVIRNSTASWQGITFKDIIKMIVDIAVNNKCTTLLIKCSLSDFNFVLISDKYFILKNKNNNYYLFPSVTNNNNILYIYLKILQ